MADEGERGAELAELLAEVRRIELGSRRLVTGVVAGGYHSVFRGAGMEFEDVREYEAGDDPRSVDWNVTARVGRLHVKKYTDERDQTVVFLLDLSPSMEAGFGGWSARGTAARLLACLALSAVRNNDRTGLISFGDAVESFVPPKRGAGHAMRILRDALALRPSGNGTGLVPALEHAHRALRRHAILFVLSDFISDGWQEALGRCARRHDVIAVRILVPELDDPGDAMLRVRDPEGGRECVVDFASASTRAAWAERTRAFCARTEADLRRLRVDRMDVPVPRTRGMEAIARPLRRFFRMRALRGEKA